MGFHTKFLKQHYYSNCDPEVYQMYLKSVSQPSYVNCYVCHFVNEECGLRRLGGGKQYGHQGANRGWERDQELSQRHLRGLSWRHTPRGTEGWKPSQPQMRQYPLQPTARHGGWWSSDLSNPGFHLYACITFTSQNFFPQVFRRTGIFLP